VGLADLQRSLHSVENALLGSRQAHTRLLAP
jgi:hypothetical protein